MSMALRVFIAPVLGMLLVAAPAAAQSLAGVAAKEQVRRQTIEAAGKAYTNADLVPDPSESPAGEEAELPNDGLPVEEASDAEPDTTDGALDEAYWRRLAATIRIRLERAREALAVVSVPSEGNERQLAKIAELKAKAQEVLDRAEEAEWRFLQEVDARRVPQEWIRPPVAGRSPGSVR